MERGCMSFFSEMGVAAGCELQQINTLMFNKPRILQRQHHQFLLKNWTTSIGQVYSPKWASCFYGKHFLRQVLGPSGSRSIEAGEWPIENLSNCSVGNCQQATERNVTLEGKSDKEASNCSSQCCTRICRDGNAELQSGCSENFFW